MTTVAEFREMLDVMRGLDDAAIADLIKNTMESAQANSITLEGDVHIPYMLKLDYVLSGDNQILRNIESYTHQITSYTGAPVHKLMRFNKRLNFALLEYDSVRLNFFSKPEYHLSGPVILAQGAPVTAMSRNLGRYAIDINGVHSQAAIQAVEHDLQKKIIKDYYEALEGLVIGPGQAYYPYMPLVSTGAAVDPATMEPSVNITTRYGIGPA